MDFGTAISVLQNRLEAIKQHIVTTGYNVDNEHWVGQLDDLLTDWMDDLTTMSGEPVEDMDVESELIQELRQHHSEPMTTNLYAIPTTSIPVFDPMAPLENTPPVTPRPVVKYPVTTVPVEDVAPVSLGEHVTLVTDPSHREVVIDPNRRYDLVEAMSDVTPLELEEIVDPDYDEMLRTVEYVKTVEQKQAEIDTALVEEIQRPKKHLVEPDTDLPDPPTTPTRQTYLQLKEVNQLSKLIDSRMFKTAFQAICFYHEEAINKAHNYGIPSYLHPLVPHDSSNQLFKDPLIEGFWYDVLDVERNNLLRMLEVVLERSFMPKKGMFREDDRLYESIGDWPQQLKRIGFGPKTSNEKMRELIVHLYAFRDRSTYTEIKEKEDGPYHEPQVNAEAPAGHPNEPTRPPGLPPNAQWIGGNRWFTPEPGVILPNPGDARPRQGEVGGQYDYFNDTEGEPDPYDEELRQKFGDLYEQQVVITTEVPRVWMNDAEAPLQKVSHTRVVSPEPSVQPRKTPHVFAMPAPKEAPPGIKFDIDALHKRNQELKAHAEEEARTRQAIRLSQEQNQAASQPQFEVGVQTQQPARQLLQDQLPDHRVQTPFQHQPQHQHPAWAAQPPGYHQAPIQPQHQHPAWAAQPPGYHQAPIQPQHHQPVQPPGYHQAPIQQHHQPVQPPGYHQAPIQQHQGYPPQHPQQPGPRPAPFQHRPPQHPTGPVTQGHADLYQQQLFSSEEDRVQRPAVRPQKTVYGPWVGGNNQPLPQQQHQTQHPDRLPPYTPAGHLSSPQHPGMMGGHPGTPVQHPPFVSSRAASGIQPPSMVAQQPERYSPIGFGYPHIEPNMEQLNNGVPAHFLTPNGQHPNALTPAQLFGHPMYPGMGYPQHGADWTRLQQEQQRHFQYYLQSGSKEPYRPYVPPGFMGGQKIQASGQQVFDPVSGRMLTVYPDGFIRSNPDWVQQGLSQPGQGGSLAPTYQPSIFEQQRLEDINVIYNRPN